MRSVIGLPRRKFSQIASANLPGIAHWTLESSTTTLADFYGTSPLTSSSSATVTAPIYRESGDIFGLGRATGQNISGASTLAQRNALRTSEVLVECLCEINSLSTDQQTLLVHRGTGAGSGDNELICIQTRTDGRIRYSRQTGTLSTAAYHSRAGAVRTGELLHIVVRIHQAGPSGDIFLTFYVNGALVGSSVSDGPPTGGDSGIWRFMSYDGAGSLAFNGTMYECRVLAQAASDAHIRDMAARALRTFDMDAMIKSQQYATFARVLVEPPTGTTQGHAEVGLVNIDNLRESANESFAGWTAHPQHRFLRSVLIRDDVDAAGATADVVVDREIYDWSLSTFVLSGPVTRFGTSYSENVFSLARRIHIEIANVPLDTEIDEVQPWEWVNEFDGFISSIDAAAGTTIRLSCRDRIAPIQWTFCRPLASNGYREKTYGDDTTPVAMETVVKQMINDHAPASDIRGGTPSVWVPVPSTWNLRKRSLGFEPLYDACASKAEQIGWSFRFRWDDNWKATRLSLYEPDRASPSVLRTFQTDEYLDLSRCFVGEDNIRNVCEVVYTDRSGTVGTQDDIPRARIQASDATSIAKYGERFCQITEDFNSQIDSATEATRLADAVIYDLAEPKADVTLEAGHLPFVELQDYYAIVANGLHFDTTQELAVIGFEHSVADGRGRTKLSLRGTPAGRVDGHLGSIAWPGIAPFNPTLPTIDPTDVKTFAIDGGILVNWESMIPKVSRAGQLGAWDMTEIHMSTAGGAWTPDLSTLAGVSRSNMAFIPNLDPTATYQIKVLHRDRNRNASAAVAGTDRKPRPSLNDSTVFRAFRGDSDGDQELSGADPLYFPTENADPFSTISRPSARPSAGTIFTAPWTGNYKFTVSLRISTAALAGRLRSTSMFFVAALNPASEGTGGTAVAISPHTGYFVGGSLPGTAHLFAWDYTYRMTAGQTMSLQAYYSDGDDVTLSEPSVRAVASVVQDANSLSKWVGYFMGAAAS